ncbi:MAG: TonB-dependent receptor [Myxococcota bacterium]
MGAVRVAGDRRGIAGASVLAVPADPDARPGGSRGAREPAPDEPRWSVAASTDDDGRFTLEGVPTGKARLLVIAPGFELTERIVEVTSGADTSADLFAAADEQTAYRTVVQARAPPPTEPRRHELSREEIQTVPGAQGDPLRAIQNLPGVARAPASLGLLVLRGAPPGQSGVFLGGHAIPRAFHVLSLSSVFAADVIDRLDFVPGNFDPAYGNATGGVVLVEPRPGRRDGVHGHGEIDLAAASALVEGPVGDGSFIIGAQRGYVDAVVAGAGAVVEQVTGESSGLLLPSYWDYQAIVDQPLPGGATFTLRALGAGDRLRGQGPPEGQDPNAGFDFRTDFHRLDVVFRKRQARIQYLLTPSVRYEFGRLVLSGDTLTRRRDDGILSVRAQGTGQITPAVDLTLGADTEVDVFRTQDDAAIVDPMTLQPLPRVVTTERGVASTVGAFMVGDLHYGRASLRPGVRANGFMVAGRHAYSIDPRATARIEFGERWAVAAGVGRYSQARPVTDSDSVDLIDQTTGVGGGNAFLPPVFSRFDPQIEFAPQDTDLTVRQAVQASTGAEVDLGRGWGVSATGYLRDQDNAEPLIFDNRVVTFATRSRNLGAELLVRKRLTAKLYGWVAYTLSYGELRFIQGNERLVGRRRPSDFDQRHNLILLASYVLPRGWRVGGRFRYVTGYPFTPVIGSIAVRGGFVPVQGNRNDGRLPPFHQLDLRVDRTWTLQRVKVHAYVDVQNVYNRQNPEAILYSADFRSEAGFVGIPIYPTIGVRVDY